jgi:hypothetical protein
MYFTVRQTFRPKSNNHEPRSCYARVISHTGTGPFGLDLIFEMINARNVSSRLATVEAKYLWLLNKRDYVTMKIYRQVKVSVNKKQHVKA